MFACHACRHPLSLASKFCPHCGAPIRGTSLLARSTPDLRASTRELMGMLSPLQVVTVVVADTATFVATYANPELAQETRQTFEALLAEPPARHGGVAKSADFGTVALFGVPVAHDDDVSRAVQAASEMRAAARALAAEAAARLKSEPLLTIAINTGLVSATFGADQGIASVLGEALEEAKRVLSLAPPGAIALSEKTWSQARNNHAFAELAPVQGAGDVRIFELAET